MQHDEPTRAPVAYTVPPLPKGAPEALAAAGIDSPEAVTACVRRQYDEDLVCRLRHPPAGVSTGFVYRLRHATPPIMFDTIMHHGLARVIPGAFTVGEDSTGAVLVSDARTGDGARLGMFYPHVRPSAEFAALLDYCPTPDALLRLSPPEVPVEHVALGDVSMMPGAWREAGLFVPILRTADGTIAPVLDQKTRRLLDRHWADVCEASGLAPRPGESAPLTLDEQRALAASALSVFYQVGLPEARVMGLVSTAILPRILAAIIDAGTLRLLVAEAAREATDAGEDPPC